MKVTLIGFMGSGKTTVGKVLSEITRYKFIDLDTLIVERTGMSIPEIFEKLGEERFRRIERDLLKETLLKDENLVISTGGGAPTYRENLKLINSLSSSVFLKVPFETLWERISSDKGRPLTKLGFEGLKELYFKRLPFYEKAHIKVECKGKSPEEIAKEIAFKLSLV